MDRKEREKLLTHGFIHSIKDPLWQNIAMTKEIKDLLLVSDVQKLARIKQNGPAYHIYPGAVHTRLSHSIGVYHLSREILLSVLSKDEDVNLSEKGIMSFLVASLLHDIGHFPYAHSLKELPLKDHEALASELILAEGPLYEAIMNAGAEPEMTASIIDKDKPTSDEETALFRRLLSGTLDPDKLDYLSRDGYFSGLPYGKQDTGYVISSLHIRNNRPLIEKEALASVEEILFSKYMMYRSLYWHKGVRAATAMIKKAVVRALLEKTIAYDELYFLDDNEFNSLLYERMNRTESLILVDMVEHNLLLERKAEKDYNPDSTIEKISTDLFKKELIEKDIYQSLKPSYPELKEYEVIIDIPEPITFESKIPVIDEMGEVHQITSSDMVFTDEVSHLFQKRLRKVALYLPDYVDKKKAQDILMRY